MKKLLFLSLVSVFTYLAKAQIQIGTDIVGENQMDYSGFSVSMPDNYTIGIGSPNAKTGNSNSTYSGHVRVFKYIQNNWVQKGSDIDGLRVRDHFGRSVIMPDSNTIAVGASRAWGIDRESGVVYIYRWNGQNWVQKGDSISGEALNDWSGLSISMPDSNTIAIGAPENRGFAVDAGHTRIYEWSGSAWIQKGMDIDGESMGDWSGFSVSMPDNRTVAIGAPGNDPNFHNQGGHVRVFRWDGQAWAQKGTDIDGVSHNFGTGYAVDMPDSNTVVVGAVWANNGRGQVRVYKYLAGTWQQKGLELNGDTTSSYFGTSIEMIDSNTLIIGAPGLSIPTSWLSTRSNQIGKSTVYYWDGNNWRQKGGEVLSVNPGDANGHSVSMPSANIVAIGAHQGDTNSRGVVRIFNLNTTTFVNKISNNKKILNISPNPANSFVQINFNETQGLSPLRVYDITGKLLESEIVNQKEITLNVESLKEGIYLFVYLNQIEKVVIAK